MRALSLGALLLISTFTMAQPGGHAPTFAFQDGATPGLMTGVRDSLTDVIVEFVEPPLLLREQSSAYAAPTPYLQRFAEFQAAIGRDAMRSTTMLSGHEYHRIFFGTAVTLTGGEIAAAVQLPYVKKVHRAKEFTAHLEKSLQQMHVPQAWSAYGVKGDGVLVAIIDSGIDYLHPALGGGMGPDFKVAGGYDFVNGDPDPMDDHGHGTHVAGIVAANSATHKGIAPQARLLAYKVLNASGKGREADILAALERVADPDQNGDPSDRPDIVNMSLGSTYGDPDDALSTAVDNATRLGITFCISAGNAGRYSPVQGKTDNYYYTAMESVGSPGTARLAITVGAVDSLDTRPEYSSKGPASGTFAIKPDVVAPGDMIESLAPGGGATVKSGTSMAAPMAAGIAALLKARTRSLVPAEIKAILMNSSRDLGLSVMKQGAGRIDAMRSLDLTTIALPGELSFGLDDPAQAVWTAFDTVTVENHDDALQSYSWTVSGTGNGVQLTATPATFFLAPHTARNVVISLSVDNTAVPIIDEDIRLRDGMAFLNGTKDTIGIPWAFARTSRMLLEFGAPAPFFVGAGENSAILPTSATFGPKVHWLDNTRLQAAGVNPGTYDFLVRYPSGGALVVREQVPFQSSTTLTFNPSEAVHTLRLEGRDDAGAPFPSTGMTLRTLVATLPSGYSLYALFPEGSTTLPVSSASSRILFHPIESHFDWRDGGRAVLPQYSPFAGMSGERVLGPSGQGYVRQNLTFVVPPGTSRAKLYSDVIAVEVVNGQEFFNVVQKGYDTFDVSGSEIHMRLALMGSSDPLHYASLAFHVNAGDLSTDILDYSTRYFTVSNDSIVVSLPTQRSAIVSAYPHDATMRFGRGPVHILSQSYNNIAGTCIQFLPNFRGGILEERFHDAKRGTYAVYDAGWQQVQRGDIAAPRDPIAMPAGWAHLVISSDNYFVRGARGSVTLLNSVNLTNQIPDPPVITSFAVLGHDGMPTDSVGKADTAALRFSSRLPLPGMMPVLDSTRVYYRRHGDKEWLALPVAFASSGTGPGVVFYSSLAACTAQDSMGIDLRIRVVDGQGQASDMTVSPAFAVGAWSGDTPTEVQDPVSTPLAFSLSQNYPNPFNPVTLIRYAIGRAGDGRATAPVHTRLHVFDLLGRQVAALVDEEKAPGNYETRFDASRLASGVYFCRLNAGGFADTRKMILLR